MSLEQIHNFLACSDTLLTGGQPSEEQLRAAAAAGVQGIINLALPTSDNALPDESGLVRSLGMEYIHIPVVWENPRRADLEQFMDAMDARRERKLLVHCAANYRVSCFVALWRILRLGWKPEQAFEDMRRIWQIETYPVWQVFVRECLSGPE